jgi:hypothetical protein
LAVYGYFKRKRKQYTIAGLAEVNCRRRQNNALNLGKNFAQIMKSKSGMKIILT